MTLPDLWKRPALVGRNEQPEDHRLTWLNRFTRDHLLWVIRFVYRVFARVKITGLENVPSAGPYLIVFNHVSIFDPPFLISFWPEPPEVLGAKETWNKPREAWAFRSYGGVVLDRKQYSRSAVEKIIRLLKNGAVVLMSPEGRLSFQPGMQRAKAGIAYVADSADVPLVPVGITGCTTDLLGRALKFKRPEVMMRIGKPFRLPPLETKQVSKKEAYQHNADFVMYQIAALLPEAYLGYYAGAGDQS